MAKNEEYKGSIDLISGLRPKNGADFPLMEAADILTGENNKRLDADLANIFAQLLTMATQEYVQSKIAELVASSPETLDTLNELAAALGNDPNFATTVLNQLGTKVDKVTGKGLSTNDFTDVYLNMLLKAVVVYNGEFNMAGNIPIVSSGREVKDSGVALSNLLQAPYIWYANQNAVALRTNPSAKIGGIEEFKVDNNMFVVMSASTVIGTAIVPDLTATTVDASVSAGNYSKFHNGDLLLYAGNALGKDIWRWIPQAEAKEDRDGLESAWDKQQINKVPTIEKNANNAINTANSALSMAKARLPIFTSPDPAEGWQTDWLFDQGWYLGGIKYSCGGHPPVLNGNYTAWAILVLENMPFRSAAGSDVAADATYRMQIAYDLVNGKSYMRISAEKTNTAWQRWIDTSKENEFLIADYMAVAQTDGTDTGNLIKKTIPADTDVITVQLANTSSDVKLTTPVDISIGWECLIHVNSEVYTLITIIHDEKEVFFTEPDGGYEGWYKIKYTANGWEKITGVNPITKIGAKEIDAKNLADKAITEEKISKIVLDRMTEVIECTQADIDAGKHVYPFSGNYRNVRYINSRYGGTSYKFPETIPERDGGEHYKAYHVEILQEYEQSEECNAFLSAFDCRTAGHYDVDIVYDFVNSKWRVTNYVVKPYAEGAE